MYFIYKIEWRFKKDVLYKTRIETDTYSEANINKGRLFNFYSLEKRKKSNLYLVALSCETSFLSEWLHAHFCGSWSSRKTSTEGNCTTKQMPKSSVMHLLNLSFNKDGLLLSVLSRKRQAEPHCCTITSHHLPHKWNHRSGGVLGPYSFLLCAQPECIMSISVTLGIAGEMPNEGSCAGHSKLVMLGLVVVPACLCSVPKANTIQKEFTEVMKIYLISFPLSLT